jgi:hypothetical protein
LLNFLRRRSSAALPTTIKIPEREFGAKRMSLRKEARDGARRCQFRRNNFKGSRERLLACRTRQSSGFALSKFNFDKARSRQNISSKNFGGERGIRTPHFPTNNNGNPHDDSQRDSQISVSSSPELSQVVTAWDKLPAPLKAAILAIVNSAEGKP